MVVDARREPWWNQVVKERPRGELVMPIMTQQYLTVVYIICTGLRNRGGNAPPTVKLGGQMPPLFPSPVRII